MICLVESHRSAVLAMAGYRNRFSNLEPRAWRPAGTVRAPCDSSAASAAPGTVRLTTAVLADGRRLPPGTYRLRFTGETAKPPVVGQLEKLERWVEFLQGNAVKGRAVASVVPGSAIKQVADSRPPAAGRHRIERLKGDDYLRIWINKNGDHVLLHLPMATTR